LTQWYRPETGSAAVPGILASSLASRGHEVKVLTGFPNYPTGIVASGYRIRRRLDETDDVGIEIRRVALYPNHGTSPAKRFLNYGSFALSACASGLSHIRDVDAIWVHNSPATVGLPSLLASAVNGPPHLMHVMDIWPDSILFSGLMEGRTYRTISRVLEAWVNLTYKKASAIACISQGALDLLIERGVPKEKLHYIPVWTDESINYPRPYDQQLAGQLGVKDKFTLLYAGNLGNAQGLDGFLNVCERLRDVTDLRVLIAGTGTAASRLQKEAAIKDLQNVRFLGQWPAEDMGRLLSISDLNLVSMNENSLASVTLPSKLPGILASGHAVIGWADGEIARILTKSGAGSVVRPGDEVGLEEAIRSAVSSGRSAMADLGERGCDYYQAEFSLHRCIDGIEHLLQSVADNPMRTPRKASNARTVR
jgi:glycosyltransferase involved in cell wall biosynthesis